MKKRILFVDDEPNVIDGLRRMLRRQRDEWEMEFAGSAAEALARMAGGPFDVVVTDIIMPQMDGTRLLERIMEYYPQTVRLVLSGHADEETMRRAVGLAHQCLSKPTDAETLKLAVARACRIQSEMRSEAIRKIVGICDALPSLPELYLEIQQVLRSETADARDVAAIIRKDMAMSAKLLQLVNSSFFGLGRRVSSVEHAVSLLGMIRIKALVLGEQLFRQFKVDRPVPGFSLESLWEHSLLVAEVARAISRREGQKEDRPDQAFTAGLLHDIGILVLVSRATNQFEKLLRLAGNDPRPFLELEREVLEVTHPQIGAYLLGLWGLPPRVIEAVAHHHVPAESTYNGLCAVTCVHVADAIAVIHECREPGFALGPYAPTVDMEYLQRLGLADRLPGWKAAAEKIFRYQQEEVSC